VFALAHENHHYWKRFCVQGVDVQIPTHVAEFAQDQAVRRVHHITGQIALALCFAQAQQQVRRHIENAACVPENLHTYDMPYIMQHMIGKLRLCVSMFFTDKRTRDVFCICGPQAVTAFSMLILLAFTDHVLLMMLSSITIVYMEAWMLLRACRHISLLQTPH
jgi:D-alanyl-D-alanine dipeptidase